VAPAGSYRHENGCGAVEPEWSLPLQGSTLHQFRRLIDVLGSCYRSIAPDCPGSGYTETPDRFVYSFDRLADGASRCTSSTSARRSDFGSPNATPSGSPG